MAEATIAGHINLSDEDPTRMCDPCKFGGVSAHAGTFCQVCSEYLCDTCEEVHRRFRATREHELKPYDMSKRRFIKQKILISSVMKCTVHDSETLKLFCLSHDVAICDRCNRTTHIRCTVKAVKEVVQEAQTKNDIGLFLENTRSFSSDIKALKDSWENDKQIIQDCCRKSIQEVNELKREVIEWIERLAKDMADTISGIENKLLTDSENDIKTAGEMSEEIQDVINSFECLGNISEDASFVLMAKRKLTVEEVKKAKDDILKKIQSIKLEFHKSAQLVTLMSKITSMGTFQTDAPAFCFQEISSVKGRNINTETQKVTGTVFMPDGRLVVCEGEGTCLVKVFSEDFRIQSELKIDSVWDMAVVSEDQVVVSQREGKCLQLLNVFQVIAKGKTIPVGMKCWGVDFKNDRIYVTCHDNTGRGGKVKVLTMTGDTVNTFNVSQGNPLYLAVNSAGDRIVVSTNNTDVQCIASTGTTLYTYTDSQLIGSLGFLFDSYDNFIVCGRGSNNLHVVKIDGTKQKIISTSKDGINHPYCLAYRPSDKTLVLGHYGTSFLVFKLN